MKNLKSTWLRNNKHHHHHPKKLTTNNNGIKKQPQPPLLPSLPKHDSLNRKRKLRIDDDDDDEADDDDNGMNGEMSSQENELSSNDMDLGFDQIGTSSAPPKLTTFLSSAAKKIKLEPTNNSSILANEFSSASSATVGLINAQQGNKTATAAVKSSKKVVEKYRRLESQKQEKKRKEGTKTGDRKENYEYPFQRVLVQYLEQKALEPVDETNGGGLAFANLAALYHMFVYCRLFSHDQFVCDLIAKGETFRANYGDIKRPISVFMNHARNRQQKLQQQKLAAAQQQQQQQQQMQQQQQNRQQFQVSTTIPN